MARSFDQRNIGTELLHRRLRLPFAQRVSTDTMHERLDLFIRLYAAVAEELGFPNSMEKARAVMSLMDCAASDQPGARQPCRSVAKRLPIVAIDLDRITHNVQAYFMVCMDNIRPEKGPQELTFLPKASLQYHNAPTTDGCVPRFSPTSPDGKTERMPCLRHDRPASSIPPARVTRMPSSPPHLGPLSDKSRAWYLVELFVPDPYSWSPL
ncbi:hypothetical protein ABIE78_003848 [Sinorhizobium fredii]